MNSLYVSFLVSSFFKREMKRTFFFINCEESSLYVIYSHQIAGILLLFIENCKFLIEKFIDRDKLWKDDNCEMRNVFVS